MFNFLKKCHTFSHRGYIILHTHQQCLRAFILHIFINTCYYQSLIPVILMSVKWYYCGISLMTNYGSIFSCAYWQFIYFLWRNIDSNLLSIFSGVVFLLFSCKNSLSLLDTICSEDHSFPH